MELTTALREGKPVIMLVGTANEQGGFVPNKEMLFNLRFMLDVRNASASVPADRDRILADIDKEPGFEAVNTLAIGAVLGAELCMEEREVLVHVLGDAAPLAALRGRDALGWALRAAAAAGLMAPLEALLARSEEVEVDAAAKDGSTALMLAAQGGHAEAIEALVTKGAEVNAANERGTTPLMMAAAGGHLKAIEALVTKGAEVNAAAKYGRTALSIARANRHEEAVATLEAARARES